MKLYSLFIGNIIPKSKLLVLPISNMTYKYIINIQSVLNTMYFYWGFSESQFKLFTDLVIVDYPIYKMRMLSIYNLVSLFYNNRILLKVFLAPNLTISSITKCYTCASWFERESWDLFGVFYLQNVDLRRLLNDYGLHGHPFKKDFPLSGYSEVVFSLFFNLVFYDSVKLTQEFRFFNTKSPWKIFYTSITK